MPNIREMKESKFLKQDECGKGILVTITACDQQNVAKDGAPADLKWCLHFSEVDKPLVLNATNAVTIASIVGSDETDNWIGHKIVLYRDPSIMYAGKIVGGIRARAPRNQQPAPPAPKTVQRHNAPPPQPIHANGRGQEDDNGEIPF